MIRVTSNNDALFCRNCLCMYERIYVRIYMYVCEREREKRELIIVTGWRKFVRALLQYIGTSETIFIRLCEDRYWYHRYDLFVESSKLCFNFISKDANVKCKYSLSFLFAHIFYILFKYFLYNYLFSPEFLYKCTPRFYIFFIYYI